MTCPRCAIDLLRSAETAFDAGRIVSAAQALLESSSEIADPGNARAVLGERARLLAYNTRPNFAYWIAALSSPPQAALPSAGEPAAIPCRSCPGTT